MEEVVDLCFEQSQYAVRFEWGERGIDALGPGSDVVIVVDVLSFTTCVDVAVSRGCTVLPYPWQEGSAAAFAESNGAILAARRQQGGFSLSPVSLMALPAGTRLVLPSPNGSALSLRAARYGTTIAGCLRNAAAVGEWAGKSNGGVAVIAAGERWRDGSLRPCWEDMVGAGAIISNLPGSLSPEASAAREVFQSVKGNICGLMLSCASGRELVERGFSADVRLASEYASSTTVPFLDGYEYVAHTGV